MAQFENISHGEANWEGKVNRNFSNVTQDSGWQALTTIAPATGTISFRVLNNILYFRNIIVPHMTGNVDVAIFPSNINTMFPMVDNGKHTTGVARIKEGKLTLFDVTEAQAESVFSFDATSLPVGTGQNLPGGVESL